MQYSHGWDSGHNDKRKGRPIAHSAQECQPGPSTRCSSPRKTTEKRSKRCSERDTARCRKRILFTSLPPVFLLPFLDTASAAPARTPRSCAPAAPITATAPATNTRPTPTRPALGKRVEYATSISTPTVFPTEVIYVDETALPYLLTQADSGEWMKDSNGWSMYGRQMTIPTGISEDADDDAAVDSAELVTIEVRSSFAVERALPHGWGTSSTRTDLYRIPLISVASVIMAVVIVALLICYVFARRKRYRKQKRAQERLRHKALIAAGLTEDDINDTAAQAAFTAKLSELEKRHRVKRGREGQIEFAKVKVKGWNARLVNMRRRKGKGKGDAASLRDILEDGDGLGQEEQRSELDRVVTNTSISTVTRTRDEDGLSPTGHPDVPADTSTPQDSPLPPPERAADNTSPPILTAPTPYFPPAYRPASVRSAPGHGDGPAPSSPGPSSSDPMTNPARGESIPGPAEKTSAPGYYPAPATEDGEVALAIASRSDGKGRVVEPLVSEEDEEGRERMRHIATDDKLVLERMRMGASAPGDSAAEGVEGLSGTAAGTGAATAPEVVLDESGFEIIEVDMTSLPTSPPVTVEQGVDHSVLPPPPQLNTRLAQYHNLDTPGPSAPPPSHLQSEPSSLPSAPPIEDDEDDEDDCPLESPAPPFVLVGEDQDDYPLESPAPPFVLVGEDQDDEDEDKQEMGGSAQGEDDARQSASTGSSGTEISSRSDVDSFPAEARHEEIGQPHSSASVERTVSSRSGSVPGFSLPRYEP